MGCQTTSDSAQLKDFSASPCSTSYSTAGTTQFANPLGPAPGSELARQAVPDCGRSKCRAVNATTQCIEDLAESAQPANPGTQLEGRGRSENRTGPSVGGHTPVARPIKAAQKRSIAVQTTHSWRLYEASWLPAAHNEAEERASLPPSLVFP